MEPVFDWLSKFFQSLTVGGWVIFVTALVAFLLSAGSYLMKNGGSRAAWFNVGIVLVALGAGLRYGIPYATELLAFGIGDSVQFIPAIQESVKEAFENVGEPWGWNDTGDDTITITGGDVTIVSTPGPMPTAVPATPTSSIPPPQPTSTTGDGTGGPGAVPTLTEDEAAATIVAITRAAATPTPSPVPTIDFDTWNVQTPAATRAPGG